MKQKTPNINFLARQKTLYLLQSRRLYLIQALSLGTLGVYAFVLISLLTYSAFLAFRVGQVNQSIEKGKSSLEQLVGYEMKYYALKQKAKQVQNVYQSLSKHNEIIDLVFKLLPSELSVKSFSIKEGGTLEFSASTPKIENIGTLMENMQQYREFESIKITNAVMDSVSVNNEAVYSFSVKLAVNNK